MTGFGYTPPGALVAQQIVDGTSATFGDVGLCDDLLTVSVEDISLPSADANFDIDTTPLSPLSGRWPRFVTKGLSRHPVLETYQPFNHATIVAGVGTFTHTPHRVGRCVGGSYRLVHGVTSDWKRRESIGFQFRRLDEINILVGTITAKLEYLKQGAPHDVNTTAEEMLRFCISLANRWPYDLRLPKATFSSEGEIFLTWLERTLRVDAALQPDGFLTWALVDGKRVSSGGDVAIANPSVIEELSSSVRRHFRGA